MSHTMNQLQKKIMRRVYYAFGLRLATSPLVTHTLLLAVSVYALSKLLHVASIMDNLRGTELANLDNFIFNSFIHAEFLTLVFVGIIIFTALSFNFSFKAPSFRRMQTM